VFLYSKFIDRTGLYQKQNAGREEYLFMYAGLEFKLWIPFAIEWQLS
jgi:hypothetical protein